MGFNSAELFVGGFAEPSRRIFSLADSPADSELMRLFKRKDLVPILRIISIWRTMLPLITVYGALSKGFGKGEEQNA